MQRSDFKHFVKLPILWGDMDALGHVNNVRYFRYLESGRIAYQDDLLPGRSANANVVLADLQCSFHRQLHYPGFVEVATRVSRIGRSSLHLCCAIFANDEAQPAATGKGVLVWFDFEAQTPAPVPQAIREAVISLEVIRPEG